MRKILDTAHQRRIRLLEILLSKNEYVTMSTLAKEVEASERTVAEDLTQLKVKYSDELHMEISRKNGVGSSTRILPALVLYSGTPSRSL